MGKIREIVEKEIKTFGVAVADVRIMRADLPVENSNAIFRRMQTEREREAKEFRAEGVEAANRITARADRERVVILAEANKTSEVLRGQGERIATRIYANAFNVDSEFYDFYRSMEAYKDSIANEKTRLIISPNSEFFRFFNKTYNR